MSTQAITEEEFKDALPMRVRKNVNPELVKQINNAVTDPEVAAVFRENVIGLTSVMREGKFKIVDYLFAVKFVSHKLLGDTQLMAWQKTFPDRYKSAKKRGVHDGEIASIASRYNQSKLVTLMMAQTLVPTHILNAPLYQEALNTQAELMRTAKSELVRTQAAANLIANLKPPETAKVELDVTMKEDDSIKELRQVTMELAEQQREMIRHGGASPRAIAESTIIPTEAEAVNE